MNCIKCGREISEAQVFCPLCLKDMRNYPVKPGIAVQLPHHKDTPGPKKMHVKRRQPPTPEEQLIKIRKWLKRMIILWLITLILLAATIYPTVEFFTGNSFLLPGQNYTTITETNPNTP